MVVKKLWETLQKTQECHYIEAKPGNQIGKEEKKTISAYSNTIQQGGGYLLFGITESDCGYVITGVKKPEQLQNDLATQCRTNFNIPIRPKIDIGIIEGKTVIAAYIPEAEAVQKPVYIKALGLSDGTYIRIGASDQRCTDEDLAELFQGRDYKPFDTTPLSHLGADAISSTAVAEYRRMRELIDPHAAELQMQDEELLVSLRCGEYRDDVFYPNIAGLLLFGTKAAVMREYPMIRCDYIRVMGNNWSAPTAKEQQFVMEMNEGLFTLIPKMIAAVMDEIPRRIHLPESGIRREDEPIVPIGVIREALVNLLMHRDYTRQATSQIIRFSDRIEFHNPGYSLKENPGEGKPGTEQRNPTIASVLHETKYAENRGYGIRMMIQEMEEIGLPAPEFISNKRERTFCACLYLHNFIEGEDISWIEQFSSFDLSADEKRVLLHARTKEVIKNADCRAVVPLDTLAMSTLLKRLRNKGILVQQGKGSATCYSIAPKYSDTESDESKSN